MLLPLPRKRKRGVFVGLREWGFSRFTGKYDSIPGRGRFAVFITRKHVIPPEYLPVLSQSRFETPGVVSSTPISLSFENVAVAANSKATVFTYTVPWPKALVITHVTLFPQDDRHSDIGFLLLCSGGSMGIPETHAVFDAQLRKVIYEDERLEVVAINYLPAKRYVSGRIIGYLEEL